MNKSIWNNYIHESFNENIENKTDILIIGGGITGLLLSYFLKDTNYKITLIDKSKLGKGVTFKTTAKITYLQGIIYQKLRNNFDLKTSKLYYESQVDAINLINNIILENNIECDFEKVPSIIFTLNKNNIKKINEEKKILEKFNVKVEELKNNKIEGGLKVYDTYQFNPTKFLSEIVNIIKNNINISTNTTAYNIKKYNDYYVVNTNKGDIKAKKVVVTCHYPFFLKKLIPLKTYIKREYVNASKTNEIKNFNAINIDKNLYSVRYYKDYIIYGSNSHKLTSKTDYAKNYQKSKNDFITNFKLNPEYTFMNQDIVSNDYLPFIGKIEDNLYISTAYNAWGMTNGTIGAKIISNLIINDYSIYQKLFDPNRQNISLFINSFINSFSYLKAYLKSIFIKNNPEYIKINDVIYGVYKDELNKKHYIKLICPHMKCSLVFNNIEKTWDCPCHGSRFNLDGNVIEGPSTEKLIDKMD